jgi:AcrR family transcriptional regulator
VTPFEDIVSRQIDSVCEAAGAVQWTSAPSLAWESMPKDLSEQSGDTGGDEPRTPLAALEALRREELDRDGRVQRELELAALEISGDVGYRALTVQLILDSCKASRGRFYKSFTNKGDCYAQGYAVAIERLATDILAPNPAGPGWLASFRAGLERLAAFVGSEPLLAKGLLAEVHVAGGAAVVKRKEVFERLSSAVDAARRENESRHSPPPITAAFILSAIEEAVVRALLRGEPQAFAATVPDLVYLAVSVYFGEEAAREVLPAG